MNTPSMTDLITIVEHSERTAWKSLWTAASETTRQAFGMHWHATAACDVMVTKQIPQWLFNRVLGLGLSQSVTESDIDELIALYHEYDVPFAISLMPDVYSAKVADWLTVRGFTIANHWYKMYRDATAPITIQTTLRVELMKPEQAELFANIIVRGFDVPEALQDIFVDVANVPHNRIYLAWDGDEAVAAGVLTIDDQVGHLNTAATLPAHRGMGAQGAIMARRIADGIEAGCRWFASETWVPETGVNHSYNNMVRHGFRLAYVRPNLFFNPDSTA